METVSDVVRSSCHVPLTVQAGASMDRSTCDCFTRVSTAIASKRSFRANRTDPTACICLVVHAYSPTSSSHHLYGSHHATSRLFCMAACLSILPFSLIPFSVVDNLFLYCQIRHRSQQCLLYRRMPLRRSKRTHLAMALNSLPSHCHKGFILCSALSTPLQS